MMHMRVDADELPCLFVLHILDLTLKKHRGYVVEDFELAPDNLD